MWIKAFITKLQHVTSKSNPRRFWGVVLTFVESQNLPIIPGTIGNGSMSGGWHLELCSQGKTVFASPKPPFQWGLYRQPEQGVVNVLEPPDRFLDGPLLRQVLREQLLPSPSA